MFICCRPPSIIGVLLHRTLIRQIPSCSVTNSTHLSSLLAVNQELTSGDQRDNSEEYTARAHGDMEHHSHHPAVVPIDATPLH